MATLDVPGANKQNRDELQIGCWAEHADKSLIFVKGLEDGNVIYELYAVEHDPVMVYTDSMPEEGFKKRFSYKPIGTSRDKWTWHDKTSFPWDRVMKDHVRPVPTMAHIADNLSAAERVARDLNLRSKTFDEENVSHTQDTTINRRRGMLTRIQSAIGSAWNELTN